MNPAIIIPTYWSTDARLGTPGTVDCYDHATPIDTQEPPIARCLQSLRQVAGLGTVIILMVAEPSVEAAAVARVHEAIQAAGLPDVVIVDSYKADAIMGQFAGVLPADLGEPVGLHGYGAIRNMGLICCCALGCDVAVFLDDDEEVMDADFLTNAVYGIGVTARSGLPIVAKSGHFLDRHNSALADRRQSLGYDRYWAKREEFNDWMTQALAGPRISRSNVVCGGCMALHAEAFTRVAFDPYITRGEDLDYLLNMRLYGMDVWFDNKWRVRHLPPKEELTAPRFLQDVYRWLYERRKLEVANGHIDLHQISADQLMPYPGPWLSAELPKRISKTAWKRAMGTREHSSYLKIRNSGIKQAHAYVDAHCGSYLDFQAYWSTLATGAWMHAGVAAILRSQGVLDPEVARIAAERNGIHDGESAY